MTLEGFAVELRNEGTLHCGFWHYPITEREQETVPQNNVPKSVPLNATRTPPLVFAQENEAAVAVDYYETLYADSHITAHVKAVDADPTHRLTDDGFKAVPMGPGTLFG